MLENIMSTVSIIPGNAHEPHTLPITDLPPGPWIKDIEKHPERLYLFLSHGFVCLITRAVDYYYCGYVMLQRDHPDYGKRYDRLDIDAHCGLTYGQDGLYGFDCNHAGDMNPIKYIRHNVANWENDGFVNDDVYRDFSYVRKHVDSIAKQFKKRYIK